MPLDGAALRRTAAGAQRPVTPIRVGARPPAQAHPSGAQGAASPPLRRCKERSHWIYRLGILGTRGRELRVHLPLPTLSPRRPTLMSLRRHHRSTPPSLSLRRREPDGGAATERQLQGCGTEPPAGRAPRRDPFSYTVCSLLRRDSTRPGYPWAGPGARPGTSVGLICLLEGGGTSDPGRRVRPGGRGGSQPGGQTGRARWPGVRGPEGDSRG